MAAQSRKSAAAEVIGKPTRRALQEYFVGTTLRAINAAFDDADIACNLDFTPTESGERRGRVQQYYATLDFSDWDDVRKFVGVYEGALNSLEQSFVGFNGDSLKRDHSVMVNLIRKDGFEYRNGRLISVNALPAASKLKEDAIKFDAHYLMRQIERIDSQVETDPRLAIGTSKELVETVCTMILNDVGKPPDKKWDLLELVKRTRDDLKLAPDDVPDSAKAADTIRKLLGNLGAITQSLAELRNSYGTGHGRDGRVKGLSPRHARLAAGAACVLSKFLFETHEHRND